MLRAVRPALPPFISPRPHTNKTQQQNQSLERLLSLVHGVGGASLLVGGAGTAKTATVSQFLASFSPEGPAATLSKVVTFSSLTTPHIFQLTIEGAVEKRQGRTCVVLFCVLCVVFVRTVPRTHNTLLHPPKTTTPKTNKLPNQTTPKSRYGPPGGKRMVVFIDDLGMPAVNEWGDQVCVVLSCCVPCCAVLCCALPLPPPTCQNHNTPTNNKNPPTTTQQKPNKKPNKTKPNKQKNPPKTKTR